MTKRPIKITDTCSFTVGNIRAYGEGEWTLDPETEAWSLGDFTINEVKTVSDKSLLDIVNDVRAQDIDWPDDIYEKLEEICQS